MQSRNALSARSLLLVCVTLLATYGALCNAQGAPAKPKVTAAPAKIQAVAATAPTASVTAKAPAAPAATTAAPKPATTASSPAKPAASAPTANAKPQAPAAAPSTPNKPAATARAKPASSTAPAKAAPKPKPVLRDPVLGDIERMLGSGAKNAESSDDQAVTIPEKQQFTDPGTRTLKRVFTRKAKVIQYSSIHAEAQQCRDAVLTRCSEQQARCQKDCELYGAFDELKCKPNQCELMYTACQRVYADQCDTYDDPQWTSMQQLDTLLRLHEEECVQNAHYQCQLMAMQCIKDVQQKQDSEAQQSFCLAPNAKNSNNDPDLDSYEVVASSCANQPREFEIRTVSVRSPSGGQVQWYNVVESAREACVRVLRECKNRHLPRCERDFRVKTVSRPRANVCNGNAHDGTDGCEYVAAEVVDTCTDNCVQGQWWSRVTSCEECYKVLDACVAACSNGDCDLAACSADAAKCSNTCPLVRALPKESPKVTPLTTPDSDSPCLCGVATGGRDCRDPCPNFSKNTTTPNPVATDDWLVKLERETLRHTTRLDQPTPPPVRRLSVRADVTGRRPLRLGLTPTIPVKPTPADSKILRELEGTKAAEAQADKWLSQTEGEVLRQQVDSELAKSAQDSLRVFQDRTPKGRSRR